jgi:hypothetical protein
MLCPGRCPRRRDAFAAEEEQVGRCASERSKHYRLYLHCGKLNLAASYLRRVRVAGCRFAAALTHDLAQSNLYSPFAKKVSGRTTHWL